MRRLVSLLVIFCLVNVSLAAPATQPIAVPYAKDRALVETRSTRLEWTDASRADRVVAAKIYSPATGDGPFPVIIFSHGLGGSREAYEYIGRQWAGHGYVVVHLQHAGSDDKVWRGNANPGNALKQAANAENSVARARDISFALDQLTKMNAERAEWKDKLDLSRIGVAGHSFGAQTALLIAGELLGGQAGERLLGKLSDARVRAVIPMSPPVPAQRDKLGDIFNPIRVPVFVMTGTQDDSPLNDTKAAERRLPFDHMRDNERYLLTLADGDHMVFSGRSRAREKPTDARHQQIIRLASTAFWDAYLKDDTSAKQWLRDGALARELSTDAALEQK